MTRELSSHLVLELARILNIEGPTRRFVLMLIPEELGRVVRLTIGGSRVK